VGLTIGVDVGGTKVAGGVVDASGTVLEQIRRPTSARDTAATLETVVDVIRELSKAHPAQAAGVGAAGWIDAGRSTVRFAPNVAWREEPLLARIAEAVDLPIVIDNDGNAAAWAEFRYGAGRDVTDSMVLVTVGTGIGSGIIVGGQLLRGAHGVAGEIGHTRSVPDGHPCGCGRAGCLEQYASGTALVRFARRAATAEPASARLLIELAGGSQAGITGPLVTRAARRGDPASLRAFEQVGRWLGPALADVVQAFDPQRLVLGGGVAEAADLLLEPVRSAYRQALGHRGRLPVAEVRLAAMGNTAGVVGAADLARLRRGTATG